jgi:Ca2+-binding EF-hand superfamily protein
MYLVYSLKDLSDEGWQKLLDELDVDNDGKISLLEFEVLRTLDSD